MRVYCAGSAVNKQFKTPGTVSSELQGTKTETLFSSLKIILNSKIFYLSY